MRARLLRCVRASSVDLHRALRLEEGLFRHRASEEWLTAFDGVARATIALGVSSKTSELVDEKEARRRDAVVVRRCTGGGTVLCDRDTLLIGMVMESRSSALFEEAAETRYPRDVMRATGARVYARVFDKCGTFATRENDYVFGDVKFGGNAQAMSRGRFLHHTSFLYDCDAEAMRAMLRTPTRAPAYRNGRSHEDFVTRLRERGYEREEIFARVRWALEAIGYEIVDVEFEEAERAVEDAVARSGGPRWDTVKTIAA